MCIQDGYKKKIAEGSRSRHLADKLGEARGFKNHKENVVNQFPNVQEKLKISEYKRNKSIDKNEQEMEQEQILIFTEQKYREAQDELEEFKYLLQDQFRQLEDYRNKYLQVDCCFFLLNFLNIISHGEYRISVQETKSVIRTYKIRLFE